MHPLSRLVAGLAAAGALGAGYFAFRPTVNETEQPTAVNQIPVWYEIVPDPLLASALQEGLEETVPDLPAPLGTTHMELNLVYDGERIVPPPKKQ